MTVAEERSLEEDLQFIATHAPDLPVLFDIVHERVSVVHKMWTNVDGDIWVIASEPSGRPWANELWSNDEFCLFPNAAMARASLDRD